MAASHRSDKFKGSNLVELGISHHFSTSPIIIGAFIFALPFYWMIRTALMPTWQIYVFPPAWFPAEFHWENFKVPFAVFPFERWFLNSAFVAVAAAIGTAHLQFHRRLQLCPAALSLPRYALCDRAGDHDPARTCATDPDLFALRHGWAGSAPFCRSSCPSGLRRPSLSSCCVSSS